MSSGFCEQDESKIDFLFENCSTSKSKYEPELMKCGKVFLCFISEDFVFFCSLCENTSSKYTIFDEFANHIKEKHMIPNKDDPNDEPYMSTEMQDYLMINHKKVEEQIDQQALSEFEIEYLNSDEELEENCKKEPLNEPMKLSLEDDNSLLTILQPQVLQWPECQVLQFIELYREQECLWNVESKLYHKSKVKEAAYQKILKKFNELNPYVLKDISSVKHAIKELQDYFEDFGEESQQTNEISSDHEIYKSLLFLKNVSESDLKNCPICRISFENSKDLEMHLNDLSTNLQKKVCDICGTKFEDRSNFITHLRRHKKEKPFVCKICAKGFVTSTELRTHTVVHSESELPFICETCGLRFRYLNRLETHKLLHGDPSFECKECNLKFLLKRQLAYHQRRHGPVEMMVSCDVCKKMYRNKDSLLRHERKIHNIRKRRSNLI